MTIANTASPTRGTVPQPRVPVRNVAVRTPVRTPMRTPAGRPPGVVRLKVAADDTRLRELSSREVQVLTLIAAGGTKDEISRRLGITPRTVASHLSRIFKALGARNAAHAVALAHGSGAIPRTPRRQPPAPPVSRREREVLAGLAHGLTSAQVAWCLSVSSETVKTHLQRIYRKLDVSSRANAVDTAIRRRLLAVVLDTRGLDTRARPERTLRPAPPAPSAYPERAARAAY